MELAHAKVQTVEQFKNFSQFLEGIIAYHKVYGGKD
jgi:CRISPR/Cas system CSM-associated protein Csm2 small subunit